MTIEDTLREREKEAQKAYERLCICKARGMRSHRSQARYDLLVKECHAIAKQMEGQRGHLQSA